MAIAGGKDEPKGLMLQSGVELMIDLFCKLRNMAFE